MASNIIINKFNGTGEKLWHIKWGTHGDASPIAITVDLEDNIYVVGTFAESCVHQTDVIILKYSKNGNLQWSRLWGTSEWDQSRSISTDLENNVYVTGELYNTTEEKYDMFILKFNSNSVFKWIRTYSEKESESGRAIISDSVNRIYIGVSKTTYIPGKDPWDYGTSIEEACLFIYDKNGNLINKTDWSRDSGCAVMKMDVDLNDNIYMASSGRVIKFNKNNELLLNFSSVYSTFYDVVVNTQENIYMASSKYLDEYEDRDYYIIVYDDSGNEICNFTCGTYDYDRLTSITVDYFNNLYIFADNWNNISLVKNPSPGEKYGPPPEDLNPEDSNPNGSNVKPLDIVLIISIGSVVSAGIVLVVFYYFKKMRVK